MITVDPTPLLAQLDIAENALALMRQKMLAATLPDLPVAVVPEPPAAANAESFFADYGAFYDWLRADKMLGPKISQDEFNGCDIICKTAGQAGYGVSWLAYALATAYHETAHTMLPVKERGGDAYYFRMYDIKGNRPSVATTLGNLTTGDGVKFAGRGYPQTTGLSNYLRAMKKLKELGLGDWDLVNNPDLMLLPEVAAPTMIYGMRDGWFTSRKLADDLPVKGKATLAQFDVSRDIINGRDQAALIAGYAVGFQGAAVAGGWKAG